MVVALDPNDSSVLQGPFIPYDGFCRDAKRSIGQETAALVIQSGLHTSAICRLQILVNHIRIE
jgi:hypothetical protein